MAALVIALVLALATALTLEPTCGAELGTYKDRPVVHIWSTDWYESIPQPAVRTKALGDALVARAGQQVRLCVRSAHDGPGVISVYAPRLEGPIQFAHGQRLRTRCATATVVAHPRLEWGGVEVQEGTYIRELGDQPVNGWVRSISIRAPL